MNVEFLAADFDILNYFNMTRSFFADVVVVQRFILDESDEQQNLTGVVLLLRDQVKPRTGFSGDIVEVLTSEGHRLAALEKYFHITLTKKQAEAIRGSRSELRGQ